MANLNTIKNWFKTGLKPTQQQFWDTWDSFWHKEDNIPVANIEGIDSLLNQKSNKSVVDNHLIDANAHANEFSLKEDKSKKGQPNGYAPLNNLGKILSDYLTIVDDLVSGGRESLLSAEQGVELQAQINQINILLQSDDVNLDHVQELVNAIKNIQTSLSTILVNDVTTGGTTKALTAEMGKVLQESKVDKVEGKGLSTEDFTTQEKAKLADLKNSNEQLLVNTTHYLLANQTAYQKIFSNGELNVKAGKKYFFRLEVGLYQFSTSGRAVSFSMLGTANVANIHLYTTIRLNGGTPAASALDALTFPENAYFTNGAMGWAGTAHIQGAFTASVDGTLIPAFKFDALPGLSVYATAGSYLILTEID